MRGYEIPAAIKSGVYDSAESILRTVYGESVERDRDNLRLTTEGIESVVTIDFDQSTQYNGLFLHGNDFGWLIIKGRYINRSRRSKVKFVCEDMVAISMVPLDAKKVLRVVDEEIQKSVEVVVARDRKDVTWEGFCTAVKAVFPDATFYNHKAVVGFDGGKATITLDSEGGYVCKAEVEFTGSLSLIRNRLVSME